MAATARRIGNEEITKEFDLPSEIRPSSPVSLVVPESTSTNVISLNDISMPSITPEEPAENTVTLDLGDDSPGISLSLDDSIVQPKPGKVSAVSAAPAVSAKVNSDMIKVSQLLVQQVKKLAIQEKQLSTEVAKVGMVKKDLPTTIATTIAKTIKTEVAVSNVSTKKSIDEMKALQKTQFENFKGEILQFLKESQQDKSQPETAQPQRVRPEISLADLQQLNEEFQHAKKEIEADYHKLAGDIQELMKQKSQLESYVYDLRTEFDFKEKHIKVLESQKKMLEKTVSDLEADITNYRDYLKK